MFRFFFHLLEWLVVEIAWKVVSVLFSEKLTRSACRKAEGLEIGRMTRWTKGQVCGNMGSKALNRAWGEVFWLLCLLDLSTLSMRSIKALGSSHGKLTSLSHPLNFWSWVESAQFKFASWRWLAVGVALDEVPCALLLQIEIMIWSTWDLNG